MNDGLWFTVQEECKSAGKSEECRPSLDDPEINLITITGKTWNAVEPLIKALKKMVLR